MLNRWLPKFVREEHPCECCPRTRVTVQASLGLPLIGTPLVHTATSFLARRVAKRSRLRRERVVFCLSV